MKKAFALIFALLLILSAFTACGNTPAPAEAPAAPAAEAPAAEAPATEPEKAPETLYLTCAAAASSSARYPYEVALCKGISEAYPELQFTLTDCQGTTDCTQKVMQGYGDFGNSMVCSDQWAYEGSHSFDGQGDDSLRCLWYDDLTPIQIVVSKDSGVETIYDLEGADFCSGGTGQTVQTVTRDIWEYLGITPKYAETSKADAADAVCNRQLVGTTATGPEPDSAVMQIAASIPVRILDWPADVLDDVLTQFPYLLYHETPAGTYDFNADYAVHVPALTQGINATSALPQEVGYKMIKAFDTTAREYWESTNATAAKQDIVALTLGSSIPLHAGTVQYLVELGVEVPENLIPAEYVPVQ